MGNADQFLTALSESGSLCDDCLAPAVGWTNRQSAYSVGKRLAAAGVIERQQGTCLVCGKIKTVSCLSGAVPQEPLTPIPSQVSASSPTPQQPSRPWSWEGHVQAAIVSHLSSSGWRISQVMDTASKARGVDIVAERDDRELWVTVKGYPQATAKTAAPTQGRHWFSQVMFDVVRYRTRHPDIALAVGLPDGFACYLNLAPTVAWLHEAAPFVFYWVAQDGTVREQ